MEFVWYFLLLGFGASPSVDFRDKFQKKKTMGLQLFQKTCQLYGTLYSNF